MKLILVFQSSIVHLCLCLLNCVAKNRVRFLLCDLEYNINISSCRGHLIDHIDSGHFALN